MRSLLFCNEMLGLGHLRRSLALADALVPDDGSTALVVTGSAAYGGLRAPAGVDILKLPGHPVDQHSRWSATTLRPPTGLALAPAELRALRSRLMVASASELGPDAAVVDTRPLGRGGELRDALRWLRAHGGCTIALGLRDIDDEPERLRSEWNDEVLAEVRELYDLALVYGSSPEGDVRIDGLQRVGLPVYPTGLVGARPAARPPADLGDGYLLATAGGGVDGFELLDAVLGALRARPLNVPAVLVTGPMMATEQVAQLRARASGLSVQVEPFRPDMDAVVAGARAVVAMAGYSTVAEVLGSGTPALLSPRTFPRVEQLNRARRWAAADHVEMLEPAALEPVAFAGRLRRLLERTPRAPVPLNGAAQAAEILTEMVGRRNSAHVAGLSSA